MYIAKRLILCVLMFTGLITNYMLRVNMSIAIVDLVASDSQDVNLCNTDKDNATERRTITRKDNSSKVDWDTSQVGWVLSAFFIGYAIFQVPGGRIAEIYGSKKTFGITMAVCAVLALITPPILTTSAGFPLVLVIRLLQGAMEAASFPALNIMVSKWVPEKEKSNFVSFAFVGGTFGTIFTYPMCGLIIKTMNWQAVFYITGAITLVWCAVWMFLVSDLPETHMTISRLERDMIVSTRGYKALDTKEQSRESEIPILQLLKDMLLSYPTVILMLCEFSNSWGLYTLLTEGPTFFKEVLDFDIGENGLYSSLPYIGRFVGAQILGSISGFFVAREIVAPVAMMKIMVITEFIFPAIGLVTLSFMTSEAVLCVMVMSIAFMFNGAIYSGHTMYGLRIAPTKAGSIMGLTNGFGSVAGIIVPLVKSAIVGEPETCDELISRWKIIFFIPAGIYTVVAILFTIFARDRVEEYDQKEYKRKYNVLW